MDIKVSYKVDTIIIDGILKSAILKITSFQYLYNMSS